MAVIGRLGVGSRSATVLDLCYHTRDKRHIRFRVGIKLAVGDYISTGTGQAVALDLL
jgi:hypothetical protein